LSGSLLGCAELLGCTELLGYTELLGCIDLLAHPNKEPLNEQVGNKSPRLPDEADDHHRQPEMADAK
jgi:hypothetical protein